MNIKKISTSELFKACQNIIEKYSYQRIIEILNLNCSKQNIQNTLKSKTRYSELKKLEWTKMLAEHKIELVDINIKALEILKRDLQKIHKEADIRFNNELADINKR